MIATGTIWEGAGALGAISQETCQSGRTRLFGSRKVWLKSDLGFYLLLFLNWNSSFFIAPPALARVWAGVVVTSFYSVAGTGAGDWRR